MKCAIHHNDFTMNQLQHGGRDCAGGVVHGDVDGEALSVALRHIGGGGAVDGGGDRDLRIRVGASADRNDARREDGNILIQGICGIASQVGRRAVLRTRAVSDAVVGVAERAAGDGGVCGSIHPFAGDHLREAVVAVEPLRAIGKIHLRPAVRHVVNIFDGMDFATWHWSESSFRDLAWRDVQQMLLRSGLNCPELSATVQFGFCLSGLRKTAVSVCFFAAHGYISLKAPSHDSGPSQGRLRAFRVFPKPVFPPRRRRYLDLSGGKHAKGKKSWADAIRNAKTVNRMFRNARGWHVLQYVVP